jgi:hypothetical protein
MSVHLLIHKELSQGREHGRGHGRELGHGHGRGGCESPLNTFVLTYFEIFMNRFFVPNFEMNNNIYRRYCNVCSLFCSLLLIHKEHGQGHEHGQELGHEHGRELGHGHGHEKLGYFGHGTL